MSDSEYIPFWKLRHIVGNEAAEIMIEAFGGRRVYVAAHPGEDSEIARAIGMEAAEALGRAISVYGPDWRPRGCPVEVPLGGGGSLHSVQRRMVAMIEAERTSAEICRELGVHERTIRRWRARLGRSVAKQARKPATALIAAE